MSKQLLQKQADTIRFLAADMVQRANSGHPGAPMGLADIATVLSKHLNINPADEKWLNRDRLVFSGGHATGLVYSLLHLWGFDVSVNDMKNFRQSGSKTPGHPEYGHTHGIEITTAGGVAGGAISVSNNTLSSITNNGTSGCNGIIFSSSTDISMRTMTTVFLVLLPRLQIHGHCQRVRLFI